MILVSVNTKNQLCEITLDHRIVSISYSLPVASNKHLNPVIFFALIKGTTILLKRIIFSRIQSVV
jgi:hypothetical protein